MIFHLTVDMASGGERDDATAERDDAVSGGASAKRSPCLILRRMLPSISAKKLRSCSPRQATSALLDQEKHQGKNNTKITQIYYI